MNKQRSPQPTKDFGYYLKSKSRFEQPNRIQNMSIDAGNAPLYQKLRLNSIDKIKKTHHRIGKLANLSTPISLSPRNNLNPKSYDRALSNTKFTARINNSSNFQKLVKYIFKFRHFISITFKESFTQIK